MIFIKQYIFVFISVFAIVANAQDTSNTLNAEQVLQLVRKFHPIAKQAIINIEKSKADILQAKASFDPILSNYIAQKTFDATNYYTYTAPEIRIPTWYGIEVSAGLENLSGKYFDPSETRGQTNYVGVSVPLAKNLVIDKRRAFLKQSKIFNTMAVVEQRAIINDLLLDAIETYWNWVREYQTYLVVKNNVEVNIKRYDLVKRAYKNGERPAIDTIEALAQLQSFQYQQNMKQLAYQNAALAMSAFLWKENDEPYYLPSMVTPQLGWENETNISKFSLALTDLLQVAQENHPDLLLYNFKLQVLAIDKKLKFQELLPKVDFRYNQLGKGYDLLKSSVQSPLFQNNFQYGLKFEMPLRISQGRSDYAKAKLKIKDTKLSQNQKILSVQVKVKSYFNEFETLKNQVALQSNSYANYQQLVKAEEAKFINGESSLFIINSRENKALEAQEKLIEIKTKYFKTIYALQWSAGLLQ